MLTMSKQSNDTKQRNALNDLTKCQQSDLYDFSASKFGKAESILAKMHNLLTPFSLHIQTHIYSTYLLAATAASDASKPVFRSFPPKAPPTRLTWHMILLAGTPKLAATISCKNSSHLYANSH